MTFPRVIGQQVIISPWIDIQYRDKKWGKTALANAYISISSYLGPDEQSLSTCFYSIDKSDKDCEELEVAADKWGLKHYREPAKRGKSNIGIYEYLVGDGSTNKNSVAIEEVKQSLKKIRDFVRKQYDIGKRSRKKFKKR